MFVKRVQDLFMFHDFSQDRKGHSEPYHLISKEYSIEITDGKRYMKEIITYSCLLQAELISAKIDQHQIITKHNKTQTPLQWRHNECDGMSNHRRLDCLLNRLFRRRK